MMYIVLFSKMAEQQSLAAVKALNLAGYSAEFINGIVKVNLADDVEPWYVYKLPEVANYGEVFTKSLQEGMRDSRAILLFYDDNKIICVFSMYKHKVKIQGTVYTHLGLCPAYIGHVRGKEYINYSKMWIKEGSYPHIVDKDSAVLTKLGPYTEIGNDILNSDFMPVKPQPININTGKFMLVCSNRIIEKNNSSLFTFFNGGNGDYLADGKYTEINCNDLIMYVNEDGEQFIMVYNMQRQETYLTSATKNIELTDVENCSTIYKNGLYNGFEIIIDEGSSLAKYFNGAVYKNNDIYQYKDIFFMWLEDEQHELITLDARKPGSGSRTKAAAQFD